VSDAITLFDIQARLAGDADGSQRRSLEAELAALQQKVKRQLDAGAPREEFGKLSALLDATTAAAEVVANTWNSCHKS
jgi:hypothetical protein